MESREVKTAPSRQFQILQHTYNSLADGQQPVSLYQIPIPFVANHLFALKTNPQPLTPHAKQYLRQLKPQPQQAQPAPEELPIEEQNDFDIGGKEESNEVVKLSLRGMKSLANVSSYLAGFMNKKK